MAAPEQSVARFQVVSGVLAQWTAADFTTAIVAGEGVVLGPVAPALLSVLIISGAQRPSALAERMVTGSSNISKLTARLTKVGLVEDTCDPKDSRAISGVPVAGRA